jgi:ABC-type transporter Mla subunit MlaD
MTYNKVKFGVGLFILLFILNVTVVIYYVLHEKGVFDKRFNYSFSTFSADPFNIGMPVKVSGFNIGYIDDIELKDNGKVKVSFSVDNKNQKWILEKSILVIRKPLLGSTQIVLYPAVDNSILKEGSSIEVFESDDINEVIYKLQPIVQKMENIVTSVDKITSYLAKDDSELVKIIKNLEQFTLLLIKNRSILTTITGDQNATDSLISTIHQLPVLMKSVNNISSDLGSDLNNISSNINKEILPEITKFLKELSSIATDIQNKLQRLDGVVNSVGGYENDILSLKEEINTGIAKSNEILEKVDSFLPKDDNSEVVLP